MSWQPIETAPKDGTEIWLGCPGHRAVGYWGTLGVLPGWISRMGPTPYDGDWPIEEHLGGNQPTHWQPAPEPPD